MLTYLYDPDSASGGVGNHMLVRLGLSLLAILSELGIEGLALTLFDLHRTREAREQAVAVDSNYQKRTSHNCIT